MAACTYGSCAPSNLIINNVTTQSSASQTAGLIADQISQAISGISGSSSFASVGPTGSSTQLAFAGGDGKAAGSAPRRWTFWANTANNWLRNTQAGAEYNGTIFTGVGGVDYLFNDRLLLGVSSGYEGINLDTSFNSGKLTSDGVALALYGGYVISPVFSLDGVVGHTWVNYKESRPGASGSYDGDRWFGAFNVNAKTAIDRWRFNASMGFFSVKEIQGGYTESNANVVAQSTAYLNQLRTKGSIGYQIPVSWGTLTPYASTRLDFDLSKSAAPVINALGQTANNGDFGALLGLGATAAIGERTTVEIEGSTTQFRSDFQAYSLRGTVRLKY